MPYGDADALDARLARDGAETAAFIVEPIQGRRGAHAPPAGYLARAREACTRHGVALVADEIQTGLGRTGTLFACQREAVAPDVLLVAKALGGGLFPLGACLASERLWSDDFALRHLSTFANNNLACLAGIVTLRALDALLPGLPDKAAHLRAALAELAARHPTTVRAVRAHGLLAAIELHPPPLDAGTTLGALQQRGLYASAVAAEIASREAVLVLPAVGEANVIRFIPPLIIETSGDRSGHVRDRRRPHAPPRPFALAPRSGERVRERGPREAGVRERGPAQAAPTTGSRLLPGREQLVPAPGAKPRVSAARGAACRVQMHRA